MKLFAVAILGVGVVLAADRNAYAKDPLRVAVATSVRGETIGVRLGAEIAELGYDAVPISPDETHDGAVLAASLQKNDAMAALVLENEGDDLVACVVERASMHRTCRQVASRKDPFDDGAIATRSVELLRTILLEPAPDSQSATRIDPQPKTSTIDAHRANPPPHVPPPRARRSVVVARLGGGILASSGIPAELIAGVGIEWLALANGALTLDANLPVTGSSVERNNGAATVRMSTLALHADARAHVQRFEGEVGAGLGAAWLQANGVTSSSSGVSTQGVDSSLLDPFVALHAAGVFFLDHAISLRVDVIGAYGLERAVIRFQGTDVAEVARPLVTSTLSLAIAWP